MRNLLTKGLPGWSVVILFVAVAAAFATFTYLRQSPIIAVTTSERTASFTITPPGSIDGNQGGYILEFGDNSHSSDIILYNGAHSSGQAVHAYTKGGTYTVSLSKKDVGGNVPISSLVVTVP